MEQSDDSNQLSSSPQDPASEQQCNVSMDSIGVASSQCGISPYDDDPEDEAMHKEFRIVTH